MGYESHKVKSWLQKNEKIINGEIPDLREKLEVSKLEDEDLSQTEQTTYWP